MNDDKGLFYYPVPSNRKERMYVREQDGVIQFRLWNQGHPRIWEEHGWMDYDMIKRAAGMYQGKGPSPLDLYDLDSARFLLKENSRKK